jgi:uncharacterized protein YdeI (YjbR/CyaY-like superfamily)
VTPSLEPDDVIHFESHRAFRAWLEEHHEDRDVIWVGYWKKATGRPSLTWEESVDVALCFGWIDGIRRRVDEEAYTIRFTPRRSGSTWSRRNIERFRILQGEDRIHPAGETAWEKRTEDNSGIYSFEQEDEPTLPEDYLARLRADDAAWADWEERPPGYRRQVAHWITSAKRASTRERRFLALLEDAAAGRKVKPLRIGEAG